MIVRIVHLSDLHFKAENVLQDVVLNSLISKISDLALPDGCRILLAITGDIAYSGKPNEYKKAGEFIKKILTILKIGIEDVFLIPGNHDVDRAKIEPKYLRWYYTLGDESALQDVISDDEAFFKVKQTTSAYFEFVKEYMTGKNSIGAYGEYVAPVSFGSSKLFIVGLNSAIFCGYDGDENRKIVLGLPQVSACESLIDKSGIVISCVHHPFEYFYAWEKPSINTVQRFSDIILSGHVHEPNNSFRVDGNSGQTVLLTSGAAYEKRTSQNGFNVLELNSEDFKGRVVFYKYLPSTHEWIKNKELNNEQDGEFTFEIPKQKQLHTGQIKKANSKTYNITLEGQFEEINRDKFSLIEANLRQMFSDAALTIRKIEPGSIKINFETISKAELIVEDLSIAGEHVLALIEEKDLLENDQSIFHWKIILKADFKEMLTNAGAAFSHGRVDELTLEDIYVSPSLRPISLKNGTKSKGFVDSGTVLKKEIGSPLKVVIYGSDSSGKSTILKWWFSRYYENGFVPVIINAETIRQVEVHHLKRLVQSSFDSQYTGVVQGSIEAFDPDRIIIMIDDFHKVRFKQSKYKANLVSNLEKQFHNVIIAGDDLLRFEEYTTKSGVRRNIFDNFQGCEIVEFGPKLRHELINKWNGLGKDPAEVNELIRLNNDSEKHVELIIGKNFVPSYPLYLLTILQASELGSLSKPEYSIHGFYYELLINEALSKAVSQPTDISLYYNLITEYCYSLFDDKTGLAQVYIDYFTKFFDKYSQDYNVDVSPQIVLNTLIDSKLLKNQGGAITISYKYVYYFFVAKYLANNISSPSIKIIVKQLCQRVHRDEFASIVMFLTHLSKDQFIITELLESSRALFNNFSPVKLEDDARFINELVNQLPPQVYKAIDIDTIKSEELREEEELHLQEKEFEPSRDVYEYDLNEDISALDGLSVLVKAIKTMEIVGQVTKKYWGELKANQKLMLAEECYMLGLRTLGFLYSTLNNTEVLMDYLNTIYKNKKPGKRFSKEEINKASREILFSLCTYGALGIVKRISNSVGFSKLQGTFKEILKKHNYNSVRLINASINLDHNSSFPWYEIKTLKEGNHKNYLVNSVLRGLVLNYLYVFMTSDAEKHKICQLLEIKMEQQLAIDATSQIRKETKPKRLLK